MPSKTALVLAPSILGINSVFTFSLFKKLSKKSPGLSFPTAVNKVVCKPSRWAPTAMFKGEPPTNALKPLISTKSAPIF